MWISSRSIQRFSTTSTSSTREIIVVPFSSRTGTGPSTTRCIGTRDGDCVLEQWFINKGLAFVDHFGNADFACLDQPLLHLQLFHQYRHHHGRVPVRTVPATRGRQVSQTQRWPIAPIRLLTTTSVGTRNC